MQLIVGTDSTWSLRAWICSQIAGIDLDLRVIDLRKASYKAEIHTVSKAGQVPILQDGDCAIHDSLAITEYLNELSDGALFPESNKERAMARSYCAELHSGFMSLRSQCPFTLDALEPLQTLDQNLQKDLARIDTLFASARGPFMFEKAGAVDAFYSILAFRLDSYGIKLQGAAGNYQAQLLQWDLLKSAIEQVRDWNRLGEC
ncbi:glutathione S-transferase [Pseudoteredinibacter isoporae]|uniref:glutathione S-transferase n=1 Tax=Pseudoteredinibacter isoporae TaxID=570281 RepID=UPI003108460C